MPLKEGMHRFSTQVVMIKCFLLNPEKNFAQTHAVVFEKNAKLLNSDTLQFPKNDVIEPKARRQDYIGCCKNQLTG